MRITLTLTETSLIVPEDVNLVCSNDIEFQIDYADEAAQQKWEELLEEGHALWLHFTFTKDSEDTETAAVLAADRSATVRFPGSLSARVYLSKEKDDFVDDRTGTSVIPCQRSILDLGSRAYSPPFDAYNTMMMLVNGRLNGRMTREEIDEIAAALRSHTNKELNRTAYKRAIAAMSPETQLTGKLTLTDDTEIEITNDILSASTVQITTSAIRDDFVLPGAVPAAELKATIMADAGIPHEYLRGAKLALTFSAMQENGKWGDVKLGEHSVYDIGDDTATGTPVTAYDAMKKLDTLTPSTCGFESGKSYSPGQIVSMIASAAGIDFTQDIDFDSSFTNNGKSSIAYQAHSYVVGAYGFPGTFTWGVIISNADAYTTDAEVATAVAATAGATITYKGTVTYPDELPAAPDMLTAYRVMYGGVRYDVSAAGQSIVTARDLLMHTLTTLCGFAYIDRETGELTVKPIAKKAATTEINPLKTLRQRVSRLPYQLYCLQTVCDYPDDNGNIVSEQRREYTLWGEGVIATMQSIPLYSGLVAAEHSQYSQRVAIYQSINALADALDPVTFRPARVETYGDPSIEPWEWLDVETKNGTVSVPAAEMVWRYRGTHTIDTGGAEAVSGLEQSQAEKIVMANKLTASQSMQNSMRNLYSHLMTTHAGLHSFRHSDIGHYKYSEFGEESEE